MVRILHIVTYMGRGGLETMIMNYYRHVDRAKVQFDFLVHRDFEADYDEEIQSLGGKIFHISRLIPWSKSYKNQLRDFFRIHEEYKIIHVHQDCLSSVALQIAEECGVPVRIAHSHNSSQDKNLKYLIKRFYMKKIPVYATDLFACSEAAGKWMFMEHSFHILKNAIEIDKYEYNVSIANKVRNKLHLGEGLVMGHVGRFDPPKNHDFLIDVFYEYTKIDSHAKLLLIGDGKGRKNIQNKVRSLKIQDKVFFLGVRSDVNELMQVMDIFVFPSLYEGLPVTMIEAQAAGLPCIISDKVSKECIVTNNLVVQKRLEESAEIWARTILKTIRIKRESRKDEIINAGYDITTASKQLESFYLKKGSK